MTTDDHMMRSLAQMGLDASLFRGVHSVIRGIDWASDSMILDDPYAPTPCLYAQPPEKPDEP